MWNRIFLLLLIVWNVLIAAEQSISEGPQETYVHIGKTVILKCKVENQVSLINCSSPYADFVAKLVVPWYPQGTFCLGSALSVLLRAVYLERHVKRLRGDIGFYTQLNG